MTNSSHEARIIPVEEMEKIPTEEEVINIQGIQGESIFYKTMSACVSQDMVGGLQQKIDKTLEYVQELSDDRLLVLIGALIVENAVDELLASIMPGYKSLQSKRDLTFSMRIEIVKALKLIPAKILNSADFVRKLRNSFVHDLSVDSFDKLDPSELQSMQDRLHGFSTEVIEDNARAFSRLVLWLTVALHIYTMHTSHLNDFIRDNRFLVNLQSFVNQENPIEKSMSMSMSDSQKAKIYNHLQNAGVRNLCPACNQDVEWKQANIVTALGMTDSSLDTSKGIPLIPVICKNCGYVRFFSAKSIGLF
jgi:predicted nucleic-acid-binding Zn-ribbon protein